MHSSCEPLHGVASQGDHSAATSQTNLELKRNGPENSLLGTKDIAQLKECLPSMDKALDSVSSTV